MSKKKRKPQKKKQKNLEFIDKLIKLSKLRGGRASVAFKDKKRYDRKRDKSIQENI